MPSQILVGVAQGGVVTAPTDYAFTYRVLKAADGSDLGGLRGVLDEPVFVEEINQGSQALSLRLDHYPSEIPWGAVVRINYPDGQEAGRWRYEGIGTKFDPSKTEYTITLAPLISEAADADFSANYSTDTTQPGSALGAVTFDVPVTTALARTLHLKAGTVSSDGKNYAYTYNNATAKDPLDQAILLGGTGWWWRCSHSGVVDVRNSSPFQHKLTMGREIASGGWEEDIHSLFNGQPVQGAQPPDGTSQLSAFAVDTNPANPYSIPNMGRRTNQVYTDTSLMDQAAVNAVAANLLAYNERVSRSLTITVVGYTLRRPRPGDAILLRAPSGDPTKGSYTVQGPYLILRVAEYGATHSYDITICGDTVVPLGLIKPLLGQDQAIAKLMQNPTRTALSPSGAVGTVGPGVLSGQGSSSNVATPSAPVGLNVSSGIDNIAQVNNAFAVATWSAPSSSEIVTRWEVQWRKATDPDQATSYSSATAYTNAGIKIPSLYQGLSYVFRVRAYNDLGTAGAWATVSATLALDTTAPAVPKGLTATRTPRGANVFWIGNGEADLQGYMLQVSIQGDGLGFRAVNQSPDLVTSMVYTAPKTDNAGNAVLQGTVLVFRLAAVDWSGNQSAWTQATANVLTDGIVFDDLQAGNITAAGTLQGGVIQTASSGIRTVMDDTGITGFDGTTTDHGAGPGVTFKTNNGSGGVFASGTISAAQIQGVAGGASGTGARMWADFSDTAPGVGPLITVTDANGTIRGQMGNLSANGNSPAQDGIRVNDANGTPILDSFGVMGVSSVLVSDGAMSPTSLAATLSNPTTWTDISATGRSFTISTRPKDVIILGFIQYTISAAGGWMAVRIACGGYTGIADATYSGSAGTPQWTFRALYIPQLAVGTYTVRWQYEVSSTSQTGAYWGWQLVALQMGQ